MTQYSEQKRSRTLVTLTRITDNYLNDVLNTSFSYLAPQLSVTLFRVAYRQDKVTTINDGNFTIIPEKMIYALRNNYNMKFQEEIVTCRHRDYQTMTRKLTRISGDVPVGDFLKLHQAKVTQYAQSWTPLCFQVHTMLVTLHIHTGEHTQSNAAHQYMH